MAMLGLSIYVSIILCLTVKVNSDLTIISAIAELKDRMDDLAEKTSVKERQLNESIDSINLKIDKLGPFSNAYTEEGDVVKTYERVIKALISEKGFVRKGLSEYEGRFKDFQKKMDKQMSVLNSTIEASHDNLERKLAENVAKLKSSWNKLQENDLTICDFPCENGGECFKDGLCKCPQMTTGDRCQTGSVMQKTQKTSSGLSVLCHENCTRNGGECIKPGTCGNCPTTRYGDNCQLETQCRDSFGMQSGQIPDSAITASSSFDYDTLGPQCGRIRTEIMGGAWCPKGIINADSYKYLQIDLGKLSVVTKVETQGRFGNGQGMEFAEFYRLEFQREDGGKWNRFRDKKGNARFEGNQNTYMAELRQVSPPIIARKIRFIPDTIRSQTVCMRVEIYGCEWIGHK